MNTWPCGAPKSTSNAFSGACLEDRPAAVLRATPGPKPWAMAQGANATTSLTPRRSESTPSDCARRTKLMKAGI